MARVQTPSETPRPHEHTAGGSRFFRFWTVTPPGKDHSQQSFRFTPYFRKAMKAASVATRRVLLAAVATHITLLAPLPAHASDDSHLGLTSGGSLRPCPKAAPTASGCVCSNPSAAPNQYMAPLRYSGGEGIAFKQLMSALVVDDAFELLDADSGDYIHARCSDGDLEVHFLPPEGGGGYVTFRLLASKPSVMRPACVTRGCVNGNNEQRAR